ncbi:MAG TPA: hypothetical protein VI864_01575 [Candidatus Bathyarchaeia archaeon]|nr:hypothetical protein [Candidatus Bathyarchaeia archaeon]
MRKQKEFGKQHDTFTCYQKLEDNIFFIQNKGIDEFEKEQKMKEELLKKMLLEFNEGRSKTYYCIAVTVLGIEELKEALNEAKKKTQGLEIKEKSRILHSMLDELAEKKHNCLKLRK